MLPFGEASKNQKFWTYKRSAKRRNLDFTLERDEFVILCESNCFYCGEKPSSEFGLASYNGKFVSNGVDRMDNSRGYTTDNTVPCCAICNFAKHKLGMIDFINHCTKVAMNHETLHGPA